MKPGSNMLPKNAPSRFRICFDASTLKRFQYANKNHLYFNFHKKKIVRYLKNRHAQDLPSVLKEEHEVIKLAQYFLYTVLKDNCSQS